MDVENRRTESSSSGWRGFFQRWIITTLSVIVAVYVLDGIDYRNWPDLLVASLVLGVLNAVLRPVLMLLSLPLLLFSLGLFMLVINAVTLWLAGWLLHPNFIVRDFWSAFWGALIISIVNLVLGAATGANRASVRVKGGYNNRRPPPPDRGGGSGGGPVIDV